MAKAMVERGFKWRQTTVAKSEAMDRPVLFAEVAALALIYRKDLEYFLFAGTGLDGIIDAAKEALSSAHDQFEKLHYEMYSMRREIKGLECMAGLAKAMKSYRDTGDEFGLDSTLRELFMRYGNDCLSVYGVYEEVGIEHSEVAAIDSMALKRVAEEEFRRHQSLSREDLMMESGKMLHETAAFLQGQQVDPEFLAALREGNEWAQIAAVQLGKLLVTRIRVENQGP
ncbi:hypothetical protein [Streptomyces phaeochromogenes]|uniref:hypothetical protein n=1 Tax=Streptomyces phaeochromogenes TaxID=1923 RepID=UPI002DDB30F2|nr:hypothetical protein [Streptomyces phaeochromogenes]WRZ31368.1 hypothetical protein OG931_28295 [Streptomyces phaeochromogenes]